MTKVEIIESLKGQAHKKEMIEMRYQDAKALREAADLIEKLSSELERVKAELTHGTTKKATNREKLLHLLTVYFNIGDSYEYSLTRVKEAFELGTMTLDDFVEFDGAKVADIADYLIECGVKVMR